MLCLHIGMPILFRLMVKQLLRGQALRLNFPKNWEHCYCPVQCLCKFWSDFVV